MASSQQLILGEGAGGAAPAYQISRSLRFNSADSAYLNRTPSSAGNRKTWTWSGWLKRSALSTGYILDAGTGPNTGLFIGGASDLLGFFDYTSPSYNLEFITTQSFRDVSAWYHIVVAVDTTQATSTNRVKIYLNGSQITAFGTATYPSQNFDTGWNNATAHRIGGLVSGGSYLNGYLTEINFIDGQQLTPSSFGETDTDTGVWKPKAYSGSYGTNGFYLKFADNSGTTSTTLGKDSSGNGNNWTPNNFSVTAGAGNDSLVDTPTPYGTDTGAGGEVRGNYATLNPLQTAQSASAPNNGNLTSPANSGVWRRLGTTMQLPTTGKWYFEYNCDSFGTFNTFSIGVFSGSMPTTNDQIGFSATEWGYDGQTGQACARNNNSTITSGFSNATSGDVLQLAYDAATGSIWFGKNNTWQGAGSPNPATGTSPTYTGVYNVTPVMVQNWATQSVNFGQRPFAYTAPSGFKALCTQNLPTPTIGATSTTQAGKYFNTVLWTGDGATSRSLTGVGFNPDFVWIKERDAALSHTLYDVIRGAGSLKALSSNDTASEAGGNADATYGYLSSFNSDGFSVERGSNGTLSYTNKNNGTYVAWCWDANGAGVPNTAGSISSTVSANTTAGFSIVTYTGTGSGTPTVGHGLGVAPSMIIVKSRSNSVNWGVGHASVGWSQAALLNLTNAFGASTYFASTAPTSTVFSIQDTSVTNISGATYVAYCFASIAGYSAFGSYTGNGSSDGTFVYTGFRPAFVLFKQSSASGIDWMIFDNKRSPYNATQARLFPSLSNAEVDGAPCDFLSNGFKMRDNNSYNNASGATYIYAAFAEFPFKYTLAR